MKLFRYSLVALGLASATCANAASIAITNAKIHTVTEQGVLENATLVIENGKISAINPDTINADETIDAQGKILTPGLINSLNSLGLVEVGAVSRTRDAREKKADMTFDASLAFNPKSTVIPYSRKGGITTDIVSPSGGESMFKGQTFVVNLSGEFDSVEKTQQGLVIELGSKSKGSRATDLQKLTYKLEDAEKALEKAKAKKKDDKKEPKELKRDEKIINAVLAGEKQLIAHVDRATDILALLKLKERFQLNLVLVGAADAVVVAEQVAAANVPVVFSATSNLPESFDSLHASLENAATLNKAGVKVVLTVNGETHNMYQLRFNAGIAVANGMPYEQALAAVTSNVAEVFDLNAGQIAVGKDADIVLWSADPFELSSKVEKIWIDGKEYDTRSRQDELRDRYMAETDMPRAYVK
ncbi:amidohydrolase family protein [Thalassotalea atypica]|uniref:amidohydrolase family protein n=1 Tax=Thalassotalea atypica TaxID=2054316 RepID=UPI002573815B|nr:amidohydrolase family protein [Thalassotalea atypica]